MHQRSAIILSPHHKVTLSSFTIRNIITIAQKLLKGLSKGGIATAQMHYFYLMEIAYASKDIKRVFRKFDIHRNNA